MRVDVARSFVRCLSLAVVALTAIYMLSTRTIKYGQKLSAHYSALRTEENKVKVAEIGTHYMFSGQKVNRTLLMKARKSINVSDSTLKSAGFPLDSSNMVTLEGDRVVFVTAASGNHLHESMDAIARVQQYINNYMLYYYDLDTNMPTTTVNKLRLLCNVVYRKFDYSRYPSHVRQLMTYAFKPLIIHEMLGEYKTLFWMDASIRFKTYTLTRVQQLANNESRGILLFDYTECSTFSTTHAKMYDYLPISREAAINVTMLAANAIYIHYSLQLYNAVIRWWVLCALQPDCIAPTRDLHCTFIGRERYANCHRFDQSALNILLTNYFDSDMTMYWDSDWKTVLDVRRGSVNVERLTVCYPNSTVTQVAKSTEYLAVT